MDLGLELTPRLRGRASAGVAASYVRDLRVEDLALTQVERGTQAPTIAKLRDRHHALARCLADGMSDAEAATICGYSISRISILKADPTFAELLAFYHESRGEAFADMQVRMATLGTDMVRELHDRLEEDPESLDNDQLLEGIKILADRTGHGPSSRNVNVNVNVGLADRMAAAMARARPAPPVLELTAEEKKS